jgi:hypothetical protein
LAAVFLQALGLQARKKLAAPVSTAGLNHFGGSTTSSSPLTIVEEPSTPPQQANKVLTRIQVLELEDEADEWSPPGSDRSCGNRLSEREREEQDRGSKDISRAHAD